MLRFENFPSRSQTQFGSGFGDTSLAEDIKDEVHSVPDRDWGRENLCPKSLECGPATLPGFSREAEDSSSNLRFRVRNYFVTLGNLMKVP